MKKLTSRKLWLAIIGFVTALLVAFGVDDMRIEQVCTIIGALGTLCAYIFAEGYADAKGSSGDTPVDEQMQNSKCEVRNDEQVEGNVSKVVNLQNDEQSQ